MERVDYGAFDRLHIVSGEVLSAEPVAGSQKMLKLVVDIGEEKRTVLAGIAKTHKCEELVGKKVVFLANLAPKRILGVDSDGMVLAVDDGTDCMLLAFEKNVKNGLRVR
ncbi:hypothetical protein AUJ17_03300 [Candidatus Micrarchaeota archaeon CG1_02_47_40]|nr:MAG: hypothetical protein AUJ17_03300 [Candidatus Micrarchaeota archaeon CG1_02_47_40]